MSVSSAQVRQAGADDSPVGSDVSKTRDTSLMSHSECSRSNKAASADSPSGGLASETSLDASTNKRYQHFHQQEPQSLHQCGSNQSGSDSGLGGCTNSISSENSLIVNATGLEQTGNVNDDVGQSKSDGESGKHHGRSDAVHGQLSDGVPCGRTIDAALNNLSKNKISSEDRNEASKSGSLLKSLATNKSDTRYLKDSAGAPSHAKSSSTGLNIPSNVDSADDDAHTATLTSRSNDGDVVNSTLASYDAVPQVRVDKIDGARNNAIDYSHASPPLTDVPKLRSALKKTTKSSTDASNRSPKSSSRNVSFNQTVIVFCEEIETSSPGEFDPPIDYRDSPDCHDSAFGARETRGDSKSTFGPGSNPCDLDLLSKIVGQDASKLTDEQLFGLLEGSPFFQDSDLNLANNLDDDTFMQRLRSDQSYLCHEAISDTDSESSLVIDEASSIINQNPRPSDRRPIRNEVASPKQERNCSLVHDKIAKAIITNSENQPTQAIVYKNEHKGGKRIDPAEESQNRSAAVVSQASIPARVKVTTVESLSKRSQPSSKPTSISNDLDSHQPNDVAQSHLKVIHSLNNLENSTNSQRVTLKQPNIDPVAFSKPQIQILKDEIVNSNQQNRLQTIRSNSPEKRVCPITAESDLEYRTTATKNSVDKYAGPMNPQSHMVPIRGTIAKGEEAKYIQSPQTNPACHICREIELNRKPPSDLPSSLSTRRASNNPLLRPETRSSLGDSHVSQQINNRERHANTVANIQHQRILQPDNSAQSCLSCREMRQEHEGHLTGSNLQHATQMPGQSRVRPIACQIVYVVDQNGNRIRALQVLRCPQPACRMKPQPARQLIGAPFSIRLPNPSSFVSEQAARLPIYMMQNSSSSSNQDSTGLSQKSLATNSRTMETGSIQTMIQNSAMAAPQHRIQASTHPGQRNHTIYYVRKPLGLQNLRNSVESSTSKGLKSFPDVHEIRRLDGIRAPVTDNHLSKLQIDPPLCQGSSSKEESATTLNPKREDNEDPSFGFSNRPAVKVVSSVIGADAMPAHPKQERRNGFPARNSANNQQAQQAIFSSQTLERQLRSHSNQGMTDGMPNTSSMYEINHNLSSYNEHSSAGDRNCHVKSKGDQRLPVGRDPNAYEPKNENAHTGKNPPKPGVAYVMNI